MVPLVTFQRALAGVLPVIVITHVHQAVPLAHALLEGGIDAMEITLRHAAGLPAIVTRSNREETPCAVVTC